MLLEAPMLDDFIEMMPMELHKWFPTRREVDHVTKLAHGTKPLTIASYWMALKKLRELRKQLDEILGGNIRPSKAPYGTLVLFQLQYDRSR